MSTDCSTVVWVRSMLVVNMKFKSRSDQLKTKEKSAISQQELHVIIINFEAAESVCHGRYLSSDTPRRPLDSLVEANSRANRRISPARSP